VRKLVIASLILFPLSAAADHMDVIEVTLKDGCTVEEYVAIAKDFNDQWAKKYGYHSEVAVPVQNEQLTSIYWLGRSASTEAFGKAWDAWRDQTRDANSVAGKLQERFTKCSENKARSGFDLY